MYQNWTLFIQQYSLGIQKKLALFTEYFKNRSLERVHVVFIDNTFDTYSFSPIQAESILVVSSHAQIEFLESADRKQEYIVDIFVLDRTKVNVLVNHKNVNSTYRFFLGQGAQLHFGMTIVDVNQSVIKIICHLLGTESCANLKVVSLLNDSQEVQLFTEQHHHAVHTKSDLVLRGFVTHNAQILHQGIITIDQQAQQTQASQQSKILLGSANAQAKSIPSLEIKAHDVRCQHGSAIGYLDEQQLFYLQSRGFDERAAQKMLVEAIFAEIDVCLHEMLKEKIDKMF